MDIITVENLSFAHRGSKIYIMEDISFSVRRGEFVILYGSSGCGKTTLLKLMKNELRPDGKQKGKIFFRGTEISKLDKRESASKIGFVMQNPENQLVTDKVYRELAFGLENLGESNSVIKRKTAEIATMFGMNKWFHNDTATLSGGQKQLLNLASAMIMSPDLLLLDEPISQLDPFSATAFVDMLVRFNREYGVTVIIAEHNLERIFSYADSIAVIDKNHLRYYGVPRTCCGFFSKEAPIVQGMPTPARIFQRFGIKTACPIDVREAREFIRRYCPNIKRKLEKPLKLNNNSYAVELSDVFFRYDKNEPDILNSLSMSVKKGEIYAVVGGNGCGKTTLLSIISGQRKPYNGKVLINGIKFNNMSKVAIIPQNPITLFTGDTLKDDLTDFAINCGIQKEIASSAVYDICRKLGIVGILHNHPYDISGGEIQKAALAKVMISNPDVILLDEPTKGVDAWSKKTIAELLKRFATEGKAIIIVTHDNDFAAETADTCGLFFDGTIISEDSSGDFYSQNDFYTTVSSRITKGFYENTVTFDEIISLCKENGGVKNDG